MEIYLSKKFNDFLITSTYLKSIVFQDVSSAPQFLLLSGFLSVSLITVYGQYIASLSVSCVPSMTVKASPTRGSDAEQTTLNVLKY